MRLALGALAISTGFAGADEWPTTWGPEIERLPNAPAAQAATDQETSPVQLTTPLIRVAFAPDALAPRQDVTDASDDVMNADDSTNELSDDEEPSGPPAAAEVEEEDEDEEEEKPKKWYDRIGFRGYAQFRLNEVVDVAPDSAPPQHAGDSSIGRNQNFLIRRARIIFSGDVSDHVYVYLQPDFASNLPGSPDANQYVQIRDWYGDIYLDACKVNRFRVGQSKVPYGWEDLQSSSNRVPLDRNDAFNSGVRNERDLGVFYYWTPVYAQELYKYVLDENLKGSGNYGVLGLGVYNGQGGSLQEQNENVHVVGRFEVPFQTHSGQIFEVGVQAYTGKYVVLGSPIRPLGLGVEDETPLNTFSTGGRAGLRDERLGASFIMYPQPIGFQAEWTIGRGPMLNDAQTEIVVDDLEGGYAMVLAKIETECYGPLFPFARWSYYDGGYKSARNAPDSYIDEWEIGCEWQFNPAAEFTVSYLITDRTNLSAISSSAPASSESYEQFIGDVLRLQLQINY